MFEYVDYVLAAVILAAVPAGHIHAIGRCAGVGIGAVRVGEDGVVDCGVVAGSVVQEAVGDFGKWAVLQSGVSICEGHEFGALFDHRAIDVAALDCGVALGHQRAEGIETVEGGQIARLAREVVADRFG